MREKVSTDRRTFLRLATLGAAGSAVVAISGEDAAAMSAPEGEEVAGYRKTEEVRRYYEAARF